MKRPPRYLAERLADFGPSLRAQLDTLRRIDGRFTQLLADPGDAIAVAALDETGAIGWSTAEPSGLLGVYVAERCRRKGLGTELATRARAALEATWPGVEWEAQAKPGTVARRFWERVRAAWAKEAA